MSSQCVLKHREIVIDHWDIIKHLSNVSLSPFSTEQKLSYVWFNMRLLLVVLNFRSCVYCIRVRSPFLRGWQTSREIEDIVTYECHTSWHMHVRYQENGRLNNIMMCFKSHPCPHKLNWEWSTNIGITNSCIDWWNSRDWAQSSAVRHVTFCSPTVNNIIKVSRFIFFVWFRSDGKDWGCSWEVTHCDWSLCLIPRQHTDI